MSFNTIAAHLATMEDLANEQIIRAQRMRANIGHAQLHHGHQRRDALRQALYGAANLEVQLQNIIATQQQALQELVLLRQHYASYPEMGRIFQTFGRVAAFHSHPARTLPGPVWPRHPFESNYWCFNPEDNLAHQCSYGYWHQDAHGNWHTVYVFRTPYQ